MGADVLLGSKRLGSPIVLLVYRPFGLLLTIRGRESSFPDINPLALLPLRQ